MSRAGLGRLGLWLQLRRSPSGAISRPDAPEGDGPLLLLYVAADAVSASAPVVKQLQASRPDLRILQLPALRGDNKTNMRAARALMSQIRPDAILLLGYQMPTALVVTAKQNDVPVFLAEARLQNKTGTWGLRSSARRTLLRALDAIMVPDEASENMIIRMGADPGRVELTGPVAEIKDPPVAPRPSATASHSCSAGVMPGWPLTSPNPRNRSYWPHIAPPCVNRIAPCCFWLRATPAASIRWRKCWRPRG